MENKPKRKETPQDRYHRTSTIRIAIRLMKNPEQDIIQRLDAVPNKAGYVKRLIRQDIAKNPTPTDQ